MNSHLLSASSESTSLCSFDKEQKQLLNLFISQNGGYPPLYFNDEELYQFSTEFSNEKKSIYDQPTITPPISPKKGKNNNIHLCNTNYNSLHESTAESYYVLNGINPALLAVGKLELNDESSIIPPTHPLDDDSLPLFVKDSEIIAPEIQPFLGMRTFIKLDAPQVINQNSIGEVRDEDKTKPSSNTKFTSCKISDLNQAFETQGKDDTTNKIRKKNKKREEIHYFIQPGDKLIPINKSTNLKYGEILPLSTFRKRNEITIDYFKLNDKENFLNFGYEKVNCFTNNIYLPRVIRKIPQIVRYKIQTETKNGYRIEKVKEIKPDSYALCPFCSIEKFNKDEHYQNVFFGRNNSNYLHHLLQYHGVFSCGSLVKEPEYRTFFQDKRGIEHDAVKCPYCDEKIDMRKIPSDDGHRLMKLLRHIKDDHKMGKFSRGSNKLKFKKRKGGG